MFIGRNYKYCVNWVVGFLWVFLIDSKLILQNG